MLAENHSMLKLGLQL